MRGTNRLTPSDFRKALMKSIRRPVPATLALTLTLGSSIGLAQQAQQPPPPMSFFITSIAKGDGGNYGGLAGADAHCQMLARRRRAGAM